MKDILLHFGGFLLFGSICVAGCIVINRLPASSDMEVGLGIVGLLLILSMLMSIGAFINLIRDIKDIIRK